MGFENFSRIYKDLATSACYSMEIANKIGYGFGKKAVDMPREMALAVNKYGGGCCFHHAWRLIYHLEKSGIPAFWGVVPEPTKERPKDQKCVVVYRTPDGMSYVADIIEDVKSSVKKEDFEIDSCKRLDGFGNIIDNSRIELENMVKKSDTPMIRGYLKIYPKPTPEISFEDYCKASEVIIV